MKRDRYQTTDILLDCLEHPVGSRLIITHSTQMSPSNYALSEVKIIEWSPSFKYVKLEYAHDKSERWEYCWNYKPVVLEVLPEEPSQTSLSVQIVKTDPVWN